MKSNATNLEAKSLAHICPRSHYTNGMQYQENMLAIQNISDGYKVIIISDNLYFDEGVLAKTSAECELLESGSILHRLSLYDESHKTKLSAKLLAGLKCLKILARWKPRIILFHGFSLIELTFVIAYKAVNPGVKLYLDSHSDKYNDQTWKSSAKTILLKKAFTIYWMAFKNYIDKIFYISLDCKDYLTKVYGLNEDKMDFLPLGGIILEEMEYKDVRTKTRIEYKYEQQDVLFIHAGKFNKQKLTLELLNAFTSIPNKNARLILAGVLNEDVKEKAMEIILKDQRILYIGWQDGKNLQRLLCASDCYIQPGTQSATLQSAICCRLPIIIAPHKSHYSYMNGNGFFVLNCKEMEYAIRRMLDKHTRTIMSKNSMKIATQLLDYTVIASKLYK
jgi:glycosyltransferase involved in cell wall biosynthesis